VNGGNAPYQTQWSIGATGMSIDNLAGGDYSVSVTDLNNCSSSSNFTIDVIGNISATITATSEITCPGEQSGILLANSSDGISPLGYLWSNNATSQSITQLPAGSYSVSITDSWGCLGSDYHVLAEPDGISVEADIMDVSCNGGNDGAISLQITGGSPPYAVLWSNDAITSSISNLEAGNYYMIITDSQHCEYSGLFTVNEPESDLFITATVNHVSCFGLADGEIMMNATGGTSPYDYSISIGSYSFNGQHPTGLISGLYEIMVTDQSGCSASGTTTIAEPNPIIAEYIKINPSCIGNNDGYIEITTNGGTSPYLYEWQQNTSDLPYIPNLLEGEYYISITDINNCMLEVGPVILEDENVSCLNIPNAFTPNGDGVNDTWVIEHLELFPAAIVQIFNRWGQKIYDSSFNTGNWDGTYNGNNMPTGGYLYVINLFDGTIPYTGILSLVR
jgi:gliding motility-associated-like protein